MLFQSTRLREARPISSELVDHADMFQSTRLREARLALVSTCGIDKQQFQSTRLREARRKQSRYGLPIFKRFNPRACVRRDPSETDRDSLAGVSIHAPA